MEGSQKTFQISDSQFEHAICAVLDEIDVDGVDSVWAVGGDAVCYFCDRKPGLDLEVPTLGAIVFTPTEDGMVCDIVTDDVVSAELIYKRFNSSEGMAHEKADLAVCEVGPQTANV